MSAWLDDLERTVQAGEAFVLVTVAGVRGSAPREPGAKMVVTGTATGGTIGGGQLEYQCTRIAVRTLLRGGPPHVRRLRRRFPLGANCGQCCGGVVDVVFERVSPDAPWLAELRRLRDARRPAVLVTPADDTTAPALVTSAGLECVEPAGDIPRQVVEDARRLIGEGGGARAVDGFLLEPLAATSFHVAVFGAGHTGSALVDVLSRLDCELRWIDPRRGVFPPAVPRQVTPIESAAPAREVAALPPGSYFVVMTHSHPLDFDIVSQVLKRGDAAYCGLIGSRSKRRRFERELRRQGVSDAALAGLTCPIGVAGISSKKPADIAIAVCAELLRARDAAAELQSGDSRVRTGAGANLHAI